MPQLPEHSNLRLLWRSFLPSSSEAIGCLVAGFLVFGAHLITVSLNIGNFMTTFFDGELVADYTNYIIGPAQQVLHNTGVNTLMVIALWSLFGFVFYSVLSFFIDILHDWRNTEREVSFMQSWQITPHPLRKTFFIQLVWRLAISAVTFLFTMALQPIVHDRLLNDNRLFGVRSLAADGVNIVVSIIIWGIIFHIYVVLLRLYMFRTRIFGEIIY